MVDSKYDIHRKKEFFFLNKDKFLFQESVV